MSNKFYSIHGEADILSDDIKKFSKKCVQNISSIYIPELRITVYPRVNETKEQTIQRYLDKTLTFKKDKNEK